MEYIKEEDRNEIKIDNFNIDEAVSNIEKLLNINRYINLFVYGNAIEMLEKITDKILNKNPELYELRNYSNLEDKCKNEKKLEISLSLDILDNLPDRYEEYSYKIEKGSKRVKIFCNSFVNNNSHICKIVYKGIKFDLNEYLNLDVNSSKIGILKIKLSGVNKIKNMSYLFSDFSSLEYLPDISKLNTSKVEDMNNISSSCSSLKSLPDISNWNTYNTLNMNNIFYECSSLENLPDISKWYTSNVVDMSNMFSGCISLFYLPDISKWNTSNLRFANGLFYECCSLQYLPDISKWHTSKITTMGLCFQDVYPY